MKDEIIIQEYNERLIEGYECSDSERSFLQRFSTINENMPWEKRFFFDELKTGLRIKATSFVGIIELESIRIIIQPKFDKTFTSIVEMVIFSNGRPYWMEVDTQGSMGKNELFTMLISNFLVEIEMLLKRGLKKDYVTQTDNLKQMRGKILLRENALRNYNLPTNMFCEFDELTEDIIENKLILKVLTLLERVPLEDFLKQRIHKMHIQFAALCNPYEEKSWPRMTYNRLNEPYRTAIIFGQLIFEQLFLQNYMSSATNFFAFLVDMNEVFERFVGKVLKTYLPTHFKVTEGKRLTNAVLLDGQRYRDIIPDIIVRDDRQEKTYVIDTKYKAYDFKKVETSDIFQLAFYAQYFQKNEIYEASIIYPVFAGVERSKTHRIDLNKHAMNTGRLYLKSVAIIQLLDAIKERNGTQLKQTALALVCEEEIKTTTV